MENTVLELNMNLRLLLEEKMSEGELIVVPWDALCDYATECISCHINLPLVLTILSLARTGM